MHGWQEPEVGIFTGECAENNVVIMMYTMSFFLRPYFSIFIMVVRSKISWEMCLIKYMDLKLQKLLGTTPFMSMAFSIFPHLIYYNGAHRTSLRFILFISVKHIFIKIHLLHSITYTFRT